MRSGRAWPGAFRRRQPVTRRYNRAHDSPRPPSRDPAGARPRVAPMINDPVLAVAVRAARRAGAVIADAARDLKRLAAHARAHGDIASSADADAEKAIIATLRAAFPGHAIVGEETGEIVRRIAGVRRGRELPLDRRPDRRHASTSSTAIRTTRCRSR